MSALDAELVNGGGPVHLPGAKHSRGKVRVVGGIREMLGLEGEPVPLPVHPAAGADERAVQEVPPVELDSRLAGEDAEHSPALPVDRLSRQCQTRVLASLLTGAM